MSHVQGTDAFRVRMKDFIFADVYNATETTLLMASIARLVLASECPERLTCVASVTRPGLTSLSFGVRSAARLLASTILNTGLVTGARRVKIIRATSVGRLWPQQCLMYKCI